MLFRCLALLLLAALPAMAQAEAPGGVSAQNAWVRYLLPSLPAGAYVSLHNDSDTPAMLRGASSPACGMLMLHESMNMGGAAMMQDLASVPVPAHGSLILAPGGYHLMCMGPKMAVGEKVEIILEFTGGSTLALEAPVYGVAGAP